MAGIKRKTVLITGATSDIGAKTAIRFAEAGWNIICHYCSTDKKASKLKKIIKRYDIEPCFLKADFTSKKQISTFINKLGKFNIDSLINNAGTYVSSKHFSKLDISHMSKTFMVNMFTPALLTSRIFVSMKQRMFGRIVNISSIAAKYGGSAYSMHYGCSKLALEGLTRTFAKEGARHNVLVNTIRPGVINTEFHKKFPKDMKKRVKMIPVGRMGKPEEVADAIYYLGSENNNFITNEVVTVAGGE
ncbi:SDR family NAD(P)-dependent oxidoreductase [Candidatus Omnitrophota bacterium]